jgi:succinoglycan biosynthesis protein ExoV
VKLYHCPIKNFGDALNTWLWPQLLPEVFDEDESVRFVGIGTLLNVGDLPPEPYKVVFGSGAGYGKRASVIDEKWRLYCVRGPLTAHALGVGAELALTDAAVLLRLLELPPPPRKSLSRFPSCPTGAVCGIGIGKRFARKPGSILLTPMGRP